jgi:hypothetical protein
MSVQIFAGIFDVFGRAGLRGNISLRNIAALNWRHLSHLGRPLLSAPLTRVATDGEQPDRIHPNTQTMQLQQCSAVKCSKVQ